MTIPLNINVFERGAAGIPTTKLVTDLAARANSYQQTITDQFGFESMQVTMTASLADVMLWLSVGLMRSVEVSGPGAQTVWEGVLTTISAQIGQKVVTLSLDAMANRVRCTYTTVLGGVGTTSSTSDANSQALYGIKDRVVPLDASNATAAGYRAAAVLAQTAYPRSHETTQATTGEQGDIQLTLSFTGWYGVLDWLVTSNTSTSTAVTTTQVGTLLAGYAAVNAFLSASTTYITASGVSSPQTIASQTTYREAVEDRLKLGNGIDPTPWGVYEDRVFRVDPWAGATPGTATYFERLGDSNIYDAHGNRVAPWDVRPNAMAHVIDLLDITPVATAPDAAARKYVGRVTCTISGDSVGCSLEPSEMDSVETRLAVLR